MWLATAYITVLVVVGYIIYFGESEFHADGCVGFLNRFITMRACSMIRGGLKRLVGKRIFGYYESFEFWLCWRPNPLLQIFYLGLVFGGYGIVLVKYYPRLPNPMVPRWQMFFGPAFVFYAVATYFWTAWSDPGRINSKNVGRFLAAYKCDALLYDEKECSTCNIPRPARSKHCRICDTCVARFDHHCGWTNTCIGERNYNKFLFFLASNSAMMLYATYITAAIGLGIVAEEKLMQVYFIDGAGNRIPASYGVVFQYMMINHGPLGSVMVLCGVMGLVLLGFLGYHLNLVRKGTTTNESFKWGDVEAWRYRTIRDRVNSLGEEQAARANESATGSGAYDPKATLKARQQQAQNEFMTANREHVNPRTFAFINRYDQGFFANLRNVVFPPSLQVNDPPPVHAKQTGASGGGGNTANGDGGVRAGAFEKCVPSSAGGAYRGKNKKKGKKA